MKLKLTLLSMLLAFIFTTGCSVSKEQAIASAKESFELGVLADSNEANEATDSFTYYLPSGLIVEETAENNLVLSKGNQLFIIFSNPAEDQLSQVNYEQDRMLEEKAILVETNETEEVFSYIIVSPFDNDNYKVIVGIGGEKGTTITDISNLKESAENLLEIVKSVNY